MATIKRFEDLIVWQKARTLVKDIYLATKDCKDYGFTDQIRRAAVSVMSNIAEGFEMGTKIEFINYLFIAKGSAGEVRAQLHIASDVGYINIGKYKDLIARAEEVSRLLHSFIVKVKTGSHMGLQHKAEQKDDPFLRQMAEFRVAYEKRLKDGTINQWLNTYIFKCLI